FVRGRTEDARPCVIRASTHPTSKSQFQSWVFPLSGLLYCRFEFWYTSLQNHPTSVTLLVLFSSSGTLPGAIGDSICKSEHKQSFWVFN
ncbi:hypothetical protein LINGRAPRIM_LOCUS1675, partial [Linum grandiflorum]